MEKYLKVEVNELGEFAVNTGDDILRYHESTFDLLTASEIAQEWMKEDSYYKALAQAETAPPPRATIDDEGKWVPAPSHGDRAKRLEIAKEIIYRIIAAGRSVASMTNEEIVTVGFYMADMILAKSKEFRESI